MTWANSFYVNLLNQDRLHKNLLPDPNGVRLLHPKTPTKWALLMVMSKRCWLSVNYINSLFLELSYQRSKSSIRRGLQRLVKFGLANVTKLRKGNLWMMTERGRQLACNPPKKSLKPVTLNKGQNHVPSH